MPRLPTWNPECHYIYEALAVKKIYLAMRETMLQAADILLEIYQQEFTIAGLTEHIDDLIARFQNKFLGDTVFRLRCDLRCKLGREDRMSGAIRLAMELNLPYDRILFSLVCACHFRAVDENGKMLPDDREFEVIYTKGIEAVLSEICGFDRYKHEQIFLEASATDNILKAKILSG